MLFVCDNFVRSKLPCDDLQGGYHEAIQVCISYSHYKKPSANNKYYLFSIVMVKPHFVNIHYELFLLRDLIFVNFCTIKDEDANLCHCFLCRNFENHCCNLRTISLVKGLSI